MKKEWTCTLSSLFCTPSSLGCEVEPRGQWQDGSRYMLSWSPAFALFSLHRVGYLLALFHTQSSQALRLHNQTQIFYPVCIEWLLGARHLKQISSSIACQNSNSAPIMSSTCLPFICIKNNELGLPQWLSGNESTCQCRRDTGSIPGPGGLHMLWSS